MGNMRLKQALHYQLDYMFWASLWVLGITSAIFIVSVLLSGVAAAGNFVFVVNAGYDYGQFTGNANAIFTIFLFVIGIVGIRSDLKFFLQNGMGRNTTFFSNLLASIIVGVVLGFINEVITVVIAMLFVNAMNPGSNFMQNWAVSSAVFIGAWQIGALISLIYYRLNRLGQVIFTISAIALVVFGFGAFANYFLRDPDAMIERIEEFVTVSQNIAINTTLITLAIAAVAAAGSFLLIRRAQIKE